MALSMHHKEKLRQWSHDVLLANRRHAGAHQYTQPSPSTYPYQWLWDSCFHAMVLRHFDPDDAKKELRSVVSQQFDNGMLPHIIYWEPGKLIDIPWGREGAVRTSTITQPPVIAETVWAVYETDGDKAFLAELYPHLKAFYEYLLTARDPRGNHLAGIINPDESGEDNSPRFDTVLGLPPVHTLAENFKSRLKLVEDFKQGNFDAPFMKQYFWVKDVPFNAILARNLRSLSGMAKMLGLPEEGAHFEHEAILVENAMRERMYDGEFFWPTYGESYRKMKCKTWAIFAPLYAGILSSDEARALIDTHLLNPAEFRAPHGLPTVSMDDPTYDPEGFWRGPVWIAVNWFVLCGALNYGRRDVAEMLLENSAKLLEKAGFREYFNPKTGEGLGAEGFTWGSLIVDMIERYEKSSTIPRGK